MNELAYLGGNHTICKALPHVQWPKLSSETIQAVHEYLMKGESLSISTASGIVAQLENAIRDYVGVQNVLSTNSGSNALHAAYTALNLDVGSEVIVQDVTFHASISPAIHSGLTPVIVDVDQETGNMSPAALERAISEQSKAVVVTHTWGHPADMDAITAICRRYGLKLIEDCSHSFGATYKKRMVGTFGDIAVASMQASKTLTAGEGGLLMTNDPALYQRALLTGHYRGRSEVQITDPLLRQYAETGLGLKYRIHPLAAVIAYHEFQLFADRICSRERLLRKLSEGLASCRGIKPPTIKSEVTMGSFFGYKPDFVPGELYLDGKPLKCDTYIAVMSAEGVDVHRPSVKPISQMPIFSSEQIPFHFAEKSWKPVVRGSLDGSHRYFENRLSLPTFTDPEDEALVDQYIAAFQKVSNALSHDHC